MNVLFLTSTFPRFAGDQQAPFVLEQARAWRAKRPLDKLFVLAPHDAGAERRETLDGIEIRRFRYMPSDKQQTLAYPAILPNIRQNPWRIFQVLPFLWAQYAAAKSIARETEIDLVYAHWVMPQGLVALALDRFCRLPYVLQNHSSDLSVFTKFGLPGRHMARAVLQRAGIFFCVNSEQKTFAESLLPDIRCHVLPMGVSLDLARAVKDQSLQDAKYAVATISRLSKKKGIQHLIDAAEVLAKNGQVFPLGIAGDGEDAEELRTRPTHADVHFTGFLSGTEKAEFFGHSFAMAFPSVNAAGDVEGMPVALLEALTSGKPTIASKATNIELLPEWPEIREDVELLEDPSDTMAFAQAIERTLNLTPTQAQARSERLRRAMGGVTWDRLIEKYLRVIDNFSSGR
ncbi:glycosyltransferase [uncultured Ruegeria sp.]|uniref:glycosyltransferase n=1 Tax=uncultured Ruegeria sp. TaxID=259304 RepID=UPI002639C139|nr:glycosyltransferase [uncultured Ruegeria sp.]